MRKKLVPVAIALAVGVPALAQQAPPSQYDQLYEERIRRTLPGERTERELEMQEQLERDRDRIRTMEEFSKPRQYEGRASISTSRPGKCPPYGLVRATVVGNRFDASMTFPIEFDRIHGHISGSQLTGRGSYGYTIEATMTDLAIIGQALKRQTIKPSPDRPIGVPPPFIQGPSREPTPEPPKIVDCLYSISLNRVS